MQSFETLLLERRGRVAVITINRPEKRNALNIKTREEGAALIEELRGDDSVGVVVITGAGDKAFIAGADIAEFAGRTAMMQRDVMVSRSLFNAIDSFPKPVIAMINGYCLGGGCELALACDIRIASESASFGQPEINLGIIPGYAGSQRLARLVGKGKAMELILTGTQITAAEAERIGLVNRVVPAMELMTEARKLAAGLARNAPIAMQYIINAINKGLEMPLAEASAFEAALFGLVASTEDMREGTTAFLEKRKPEFKGR